MEDRYLFKAKFDDSDRWVKGQLVEVNDTYLIIPNHASKILAGWFSTSNVVEVKKDTICQCTGLRDKNGKLIWENDIVVCRDFTEEKYVIAWKQDEACFEYQQYGCSIMNFEQLSGCEVEVIGNIFDNAGLLESEG